MKISKETIDILKNFSVINQSIQFEEGNVIRTISPSKSIAAFAEVAEEFPRTCAIYDLTKFLSALSAFNDPDVTFGESGYTVSQGKASFSLSYVDPSMIIVPAKKTIDFPKADVEVELPVAVYEKVMKLGGIAGLPDVAFIADGKTCQFAAINAEESANTEAKEEIGETEEEFRAVISALNLKIIPRDYNVQISKRGISKFDGGNVVYYIAVSSKYSDMG